MKNLNNIEQAQKTIDTNISFIYNLVNYESITTYIFSHRATFEQACESAELIEEQLRKINGKHLTREARVCIDDIREIIDYNKTIYGEEGK